MERNVKYLIIGAGISGLTFANYADGDYLIVEKEDEVGGYCRTIKEKDYVWDYAGHFFHFSTDEFKKRFIDSVDEDEIIYKDKNTKIIYKGELVDYPFQTNIHQLEKSEFIDCLYDLFHKEEKEEYDNFLDMLYGKFGKSIVEKFLKPYNEKLYAVDLTTLDKDAMLEYVQKSGGKIIANKGATFYAVSASVCRLCGLLLSAYDSTATVSSMMHGEYGIDDVCLSTLSMIGPNGLKGKVPVPLTDEEVEKLKKSADALKSVIAQIEL